MLTIKDGKKILTTPVSAEDLKDIHIGDVVYLNGDLTTCRDVAHRRLVEEGRPLPVDVKDAAIFHAGHHSPSGGRQVRDGVCGPHHLHAHGEVRV